MYNSTNLANSVSFTGHSNGPAQESYEFTELKLAVYPRYSIQWNSFNEKHHVSLQIRY